MKPLVFCALCAAALTLLDPSVNAQEKAVASAAEYKVVKTLTVGGDGRWDFITVDPASHRLFLPRSTHTQVVDADNGKVLSDWTGTAGVHGVAVVPDKNLAFTSNGRSANISVFDLKTNEKVADVKAGNGPDAIIFDDASGKVLCMNHRGGTVTLISIGPDGRTFTPQELEVGGALEVAVVDGDGHAFVNVEDKSEVVEIDTKAGTVMNHWPIKDGEGPTGLAIDTKRHRLFTGCDGNHRAVIMDSTNGNVLAALPIGEHCDGCAFDPGTGDAFASCGDGTITVIRETGDGKFGVAQTVKTKPAAKTIARDPQSHQLYLPTAEFETAAGATRPSMKAGSFQILVVSRGNGS